ncbi:hypothetical protein NQZ68_036597 [Dissostichus eleginoides]|nr:hypothetical protein NQZ68_036597 [Dissostichus eleginoides]
MATIHSAQCVSSCRDGAHGSAFGDKLLKRLMFFLGTDGCLAVQDRWRSSCSLSPPGFMQLLHHNAT